MSAIVHVLMQRSALERKVLALLGVFAVITFCWVLVGERVSRRLELIDAVARGRRQLTAEQRVAEQRPRHMAELRMLEERLAQALAELPDTREIPEILESVSARARNVGLEVMQVKPMPEQPRDFYAEIPVLLTVEGGFHQVAAFFDEVSRLPRIININQVSIKDPRFADGTAVIKAECMVTTFRYLEERERTKEAKGQGGPKQRGKQ